MTSLRTLGEGMTKMTGAVTSGITAFGASTAGALQANLDLVGSAVGTGLEQLGRIVPLAKQQRRRAPAFRRVPRLNVRTDGPVVVLTFSAPPINAADATRKPATAVTTGAGASAGTRGYALLCPTAEDAAALRKAVVLAMRGAQDRSRLRHM
jgi:hypothetical protein